MQVIRNYEFQVYRDKDGVEVLAGVIPESVCVHMAGTEVDYEAGSYEVIHANHTVNYMDKDQFEARFNSAETPETLEVHEVKTKHKAKAKGGG